jgi:LPS-assembly lipoprotein
MRTHDKTRRTVLRAGGALLLASALPACGFKLRGAEGSYNLPFNSIYIGFPDTSALGAQLKRQLRAGDRVVIAEQATDADAVFVVLGEQQGRQILSLNSLGRVREFLLTYTLSFTVRDRQGVVLLAPTEIALRRNMAVDETQVLAKEAEAALLYRDMQADLVQQILRRLSAIKPTA